MPENTATPGLGFHRSKTIATLLAFVAGSIGAHRLYLGARYWWVYAMVSIPAMVLAFEGDPWYEQWPFCVAALVAVLASGEAILFALTPDAQWDSRYNADSGRESRSGVFVIIIAIVALMAGTILLMSLLAIFLQQVFEALQ